MLRAMAFVVINRNAGLTWRVSNKRITRQEEKS
jgi:hypothetical protein